MVQIQAVLFDLDGTLIDTERFYRVCWPQALAAHGYEMSDEQALSMRSLGRPFAPARLKGWFGQDLDYAAVRNTRKQLMEEMIAREGIVVKPGAEELLKFLHQRGITAAVVTATDLERAGRYLQQVGLKDCFDRIISATQVDQGKPAPDIYEFACRELGVAPEHCIAVEDSPNGVRSAYGAGCKVIMVPDQTQPDEELAKCLLASVSELAEIIKFVS